jgi:hypothetical protein
VIQSTLARKLAVIAIPLMWRGAKAVHRRRKARKATASGAAAGGTKT